MTGTVPALEIPELGPLLGRLAAADGSAPRDRELEPVRLELLSALFEAAGRARALADQGDAAGAHSALSREAWLGIWEKAAGDAAIRVTAAIERRLRDAAAVSRIGPRLLAGQLPAADERRVLTARLSAAGIGLERATAQLAHDPAAWGEALRLSAGELAGAWDTLAALVARELAGWERRIQEVRGWRRPWKPLVIIAGAALLFAVWLGLSLGGYVPIPGFLKPLAEWYWSIGWP